MGMQYQSNILFIETDDSCLPMLRTMLAQYTGSDAWSEDFGSGRELKATRGGDRSQEDVFFRLIIDAVVVSLDVEG
jgi:hypothetical protein